MSRLQFNHTARDLFTQSIFKKIIQPNAHFFCHILELQNFFDLKFEFSFLINYSLEIWILFCELNQKKILEIRHWQKSKNNYLIGRKCAGLIDITKWPVYAVLWKMIEAVGLCNNFLILRVSQIIFNVTIGTIWCRKRRILMKIYQFLLFSWKFWIFHSQPSYSKPRRHWIPFNDQLSFTQSQ